jgi:5-methyltetrahydropteroyltriglutamate--homocysteine methyltransferase
VLQNPDRILTTHVGSLPRPPELIRLLMAQDNGEAFDPAELSASIRDAVASVVRQQREAGVDVVSDGEMSKISYVTYVKARFSGFEGEGGRRVPRDLLDYPEYMQRLAQTGGSPALKRPRCVGPIRVKDRTLLESDLANFRAAVDAAQPAAAFLSAASPGVIAVFMRNEHYPSHEAYLEALAEAMREEYEAIVDAGFLLQIDCPDLAMGRHILFADASVEEFRRNAALQVEALNHATANIPPERMRMHVCWGNYNGPHHWDIPLRDIVDIVLRARPRFLLFEAANPRHAHEWQVWREAKLPDDKVLVPGVVESCSNYIEHPELVAERLLRFAAIVGRERVMAGSDCGFSTFAGYPPVDPQIAWAKLQAMAEGARLASDQLARDGV